MHKIFRGKTKARQHIHPRSNIIALPNFLCTTRNAKVGSYSHSMVSNSRSYQERISVQGLVLLFLSPIQQMVNCLGAQDRTDVHGFMALLHRLDEGSRRHNNISGCIDYMNFHRRIRLWEVERREPFCLYMIARHYEVLESSSGKTKTFLFVGRKQFYMTIQSSLHFSPRTQCGDLRMCTMQL